MAVNVAGGLVGRSSLLPVRGPKGGSWGLGHVLFLDLSAGYMDVFTLWSHWTMYLWLVYFSTCTLYFNKKFTGTKNWLKLWWRNSEYRWRLWGAGSMEACRRLLGLMGTFYFLIWLVVTRVSSLCENSSSCKCVHFLYVHCISIKLTSSKILSGGREVISVTTTAQSTRTNKWTRGAAWPTRPALSLDSPCPESLP